jgi:uncharacterized protein YkwD
MLFSAAFGLAADTFSEAKRFVPWDKYDQFTVSEFKKYGPANKQIDFENIDFPLLNAAIFYETNRMRQKYGRKPYNHSVAMERAALMHTLDMAAGNFFSHQNPRNPEKREPSDRTALFGGGAAGENIATTFGIQYKAGTAVSSISSIPPHTYNSFAEALVDSWMHSPGHRANILDEYGIGYKYLGCGAYPVPNDRWHKFYATQNFSFSAKGAGRETIGKGAGKEAENGKEAGTADAGQTAEGGQKTAAAGSGGAGERAETSGAGEAAASGPEKFTLENNNVLVNRGGGRWEQLSSKGEAIFTYREENREDDFVYLYDQSRTLRLAVPLHGGKLYFRRGTRGAWEVWTITRRLEK